MIYRPTPITEAKGRVLDIRIKNHIMELRRSFEFSSTKSTKSAIILDTPEFCRGGARIEAIQQRITKLENEVSALSPT